MSVKGVYALLEKSFLRNEKVAALNIDSPGHKPLPDGAIAVLANRKYENSNMSIGRIANHRRDFNHGEGQWSSLGSASERGFPKSCAYDVDGKVLTRNIENATNAVENKAQVRGADNISTIARVEAKKEIVAWGQKIQTDVNEFLTNLDVDIKKEVGKQLREEIENRPIIRIVVPGKSDVLIKNRTHEKFQEVMMKISAGMNILLVGPTGSGKTYLAKQVAEALEVPFTFNSMSEGVSEASLLGRTLPDSNGNWIYKPSPFVKAYINGGVHLLDELDAADPNLLVQINAALANGYLSVPFSDSPEPFKQHERFYIISAANTFGRGADREYVGRNQLDTATLNRYTFGRVFIDYDSELEKAILEELLLNTTEQGNEKRVFDWAFFLRDKIHSEKLRRVMSTRNIEDAGRLLIASKGDTNLIHETYFEDWRKDERQRVEADNAYRLLESEVS